MDGVEGGSVASDYVNQNALGDLQHTILRRQSALNPTKLIVERWQRQLEHHNMPARMANSAE
jgi:hypothetical protein